MIHSLHAKNYGCLVDVEATLTPLHAFVGPNDSGKSTLLHALRVLIYYAAHQPSLNSGGDWPFPSHLGGDGTQATQLRCGITGGDFGFGDPTVGRDTAASAEKVRAQLRVARLIRLDPDALRQPSGLIPEREPVGFLDDRGHGLAGVYFAIRNGNDDAFSAIVADVRRHFPTIRGLRVKAVTSSEVVLEAELANGAKVEPPRMSEGLLYYLAFAALRWLDPVSLLLVEELENGLHPARIADVIRIFRSIVEDTGTQVIMSTHSPLVVNELTADEVSVVTRKQDEGTRVTRIKDTPDFAERSKVYALGELWIAYANGEDEAPLLEGTEP